MSNTFVFDIVTLLAFSQNIAPPSPEAVFASSMKPAPTLNSNKQPSIIALLLLWAEIAPPFTDETEYEKFVLIMHTLSPYKSIEPPSPKADLLLPVL